MAISIYLPPGARQFIPFCMASPARVLMTTSTPRYATAGSQKKIEYLHSLGVHNTICYLEEDFETEIMRDLADFSAVMAISIYLPPGARQFIPFCMASPARVSSFITINRFTAWICGSCPFKIRIRSRIINWNCSGWRADDDFPDISAVIQTVIRFFYVFKGKDF
jgi:hypothetical protein